MARFSTTGGLSGVLYAVAALALGGFAIYQMRVQGFALTELRVIVAWAGAAWFAFRAVMMFTNGFTRKADDDDKTGEKGDE